MPKKIDFAYSRTAPRGRKPKYPWASLQAIGDYFDVPEAAAKGLRNCAYRFSNLSGFVVRTFLLKDNATRRVMLVEIEEGATNG